MLDTKLGLSNPDEGLVGGASVRKDMKGRRPEQEAVKVHFERIKSMLNIDRSTWMSNWMDLANHFLPARGRWMYGEAWDTNKGWRRNWSIVDSTPLQANNILRAGLASGTASEARPWFTYELSDEQMMEAQGVKEWLASATKTVRDILARSNFYNAISECFGEYGVFGIMAMGREWPLPKQDEDDIPHFQPYTIGSYFIGNDRHRRAALFMREFRWTVRQIVEKFAIRESDGSFNSANDAAWVNISLRTRGLWLEGQKDVWVDIVHAIEENAEYKPKTMGWRGMRFRSVYYERGGQPDKILSDSSKKSEAEVDDDKKALRIKGFRDFPVFVARWYTNSEDAWGRGPAMDALGDARSLQLQQKRKAQAVDKLIDPPTVAHPSMRNQRTSLLAGDTTYVAPEGGQIGFAPAYEIKPELEGQIEDIKETQGRVNAVMHADIFALFIQAERSAPGGQAETAAEINAKQQEKLLMLGPVLGQMNFDLFNPLHDWLFASCLRHGKFPPMPQGLKGQIRVKYISILAQAINAVTSASIDELTRYVLSVGQLEQMQGNPALDKFDPDVAIEEKAKATGAPPRIVRSDDAVAKIRAQRSQQQQQQQQQEQMQAAAQAAQQHSSAVKNMGQTPGPGGQGNMLDVLAQAAGAGQSA